MAVDNTSRALEFEVLGGHVQIHLNSVRLSCRLSKHCGRPERKPSHHAILGDCVWKVLAASWAAME